MFLHPSLTRKRQPESDPDQEERQGNSEERPVPGRRDKPEPDQGEKQRHETEDDETGEIDSLLRYHRIALGVWMEDPENSRNMCSTTLLCKLMGKQVKDVMREMRGTNLLDDPRTL
jgi:hypothetical protein